MVLTRISLVIPLGMINVMQGTAQRFELPTGGRDWAPSRRSPGTREHHFDGIHFKPRKLPENAQTPPPHLHDLPSKSRAVPVWSRCSSEGSGAYLSRCSSGRCVGRFLPFAIYSQTDSPQECPSNEKYHETKSLFLPERPSGVTHSTRISTPPFCPPHLEPERKGRFQVFFGGKFFLAVFQI